MIALICGIKKKKNDTNELIYKTNRLTDIENKLMVTKGEVGVGTDEECVVNRYKLLYTK